VKKILYILFPVIAAIVIALISCQFAINTPDLPVLKTPGDKAAAVSLKPLFEWEKDAKAEDVVYTFRLYRVTNGGTELVLQAEDVKGSQYQLTEELSPSQSYSWEISFATKLNKRGTSGEHFFTTRDLAQLVFELPDASVEENSVINIDLQSFLLDQEEAEINFELLSGPGKVEDGFYSFNPQYEDAGNYVVEILASDSIRRIKTEFELTVKDRYRPPVVKNLQEAFEVNQGEQIVVDLKSKVINPESNPLRFILAQGPGEIKDGVYYLQPDFSKKGRQQVKIIIEDPATQLEVDFHVVIHAVNRSPAFGLIPIQEAIEAQPFMMDLTEFIIDPDGDALTFLKTGGPGLLSAEGLFSYQPDHEAAGDYTVDFKVSDGVNIIDDEFLLTVKNTNRKPQPIEASKTITHDLKEAQPFKIDLSSLYIDPDKDTLIYRLVQGPGNIQDNMYHFEPDFNSHGQQEIVIEIDDGKAILLSRHVLNIENINRVPELVIDESAISQPTAKRDDFRIDWDSFDPDNEQITFNVYFSDYQPPSLCATNLTAQSFSPYEWGIKLEPGKKYYWKIEAIDESGSKTTSSLQSIVLENDPPKQPLLTTKTHEKKAIGMPYTIKWVCSDDDDALGHHYTLYLGESPELLTVIEQGLIEQEYTFKNLKQGKTYYFQIKVEDPHGGVNESQLMTLSVKQPPQPPEFSFDSNEQPLFAATDVVLQWNMPQSNDDEPLTFDVYLGTSKERLRLVEKDTTETRFSPPALTGNTHYFWQVIVKDEYGLSSSSPIMAFETSEGPGSVLWSYAVKYDIRSSPAISNDGMIVFGADDNYLYAINQEGELEWKFNCSNVVYPSPTIGSDGTIYVAAGHQSIYAVDPEGNMLWHKEISSGCYSSPAVDRDGVVYIGDSAGLLHAISRSGEILWTFQAADEIRSSPSIGLSGTIYFGSDDHHLYALNKDGTLKWSYQTDGFIRSSPALDSQERVYFGSFDGSLYVLNHRGALIWKFQTGSQLRSSPSVYYDGTVYIGAFDGKLYAIDQEGRKKWAYAVEEGPFWSSSPAIGDDGTIYVGTWEKRILAIDSNGDLRWQLEVDDYIKSSPVIDSGGSLYIGTYGAKLLSIATDSQGLSKDSPWPMFRKDAKHTACQ